MRRGEVSVRWNRTYQCCWVLQLNNLFNTESFTCIFLLGHLTFLKNASSRSFLGSKTKLVKSVQIPPFTNIYFPFENSDRKFDSQVTAGGDKLIKCSTSALSSHPPLVPHWCVYNWGTLRYSGVSVGTDTSTNFIYVPLFADAIQSSTEMQQAQNDVMTSFNLEKIHTQCFKTLR